MKRKLHKELQALLDFYQRQRQNPPDEYGHGSSIIKNPGFFTLQDLQTHLSNPLLRPEWAHVKLRGERIELEKSVFFKTVQGRQLEFMEKGALGDAVNAGAAVVLEGLDVLDADINEFAMRLDTSRPCVMASAVAFFSQKSSEAYGGHFDIDDVLVVQLEGRKTWQLFSRVNRRLVNIENLRDEQLGPVRHEITMRPGDALYVAAGVPHRCITASDYSLHLSFDISDASTTTAEIASEAGRRYGQETAPSYAGAGDVIARYTSVISDPAFAAALEERVAQKRKEIADFRECIGRASLLRCFNKFK